MADKTVKVDLGTLNLSRLENAAHFKVYSGNAKQGEIIVSKGGVRWKGKNKQIFQMLSWNQFFDKLGA